MTSRSATRSVKALVLLLASLTAAKPLHNGQPNLGDRQSAPDTAVARPTITEAAQIGAAKLVARDEPVANTAAVTMTLDGGETKLCSILSVTAETIPNNVNHGSSIETLPALTIAPTLLCQCDGDEVGGLETSKGSDGLDTTLCGLAEGTSAGPAVATNPAAMVPDPNYANEWCQTIDLNEPNNLVTLWEDKNVSIVLDSYTRGKEEGWLQNLVEAVLPNKGGVGNGGCGVIGGSCSLGLDCNAMVAEGKGAEYWILKAVEGYHDKLQVAHEFLQDTTIDGILSVDTIASDFSAPLPTGSMNALSMIASLISAGVFLAGSATGVVGVAASEIGIAAAAAKAAAQAAANAARTAERAAAAKVMDGIAAAAAKRQSIAGGSTRVTNALGAGLWTTASCFTVIGAFTDPKEQVEAGDLTPLLQSMFKSAREQIATQGNVAMGRGGNYSALPTAKGSGYAPALADDSYIAGFFSDGKFLLAESNPTFNSSIHDSYGTFKAKLVDQALQAGGLRVFAVTDYDTEDVCNDYAGYGAQWMDPLGDGNKFCMQLYRDNTDDQSAGYNTDFVNYDWVVPEQTVFDKLTKDYGFDMANYYAAAAQCNKAQLEDNMPDYTTMQIDGVTPACYYNIKSQKGTLQRACHGKDNSLCHSGFTFVDF